jgi:thiol-disulfide isomerase/thioredoxin
MKTIRPLVLLLLLLVLPRTAAATYRVGDIVTEVTNLLDRATGQPVPLSQLEGKVLFIDFFAHWCPVCRGAAPQIEREIDDWYTSRAGNLDGVPLLHIGANLQADNNNNNRNATTTFIQTYNIPLTIQDPSRRLQGRFGPTSGQPTFVIINGLTNSPTHRPWELLFARFSYQDSTQSRPIDAFRAAIDSVQAGPATVHSFAVQADGTWKFSAIGGPRAPQSVEWSPDLNFWSPAGAIVPPGTTFPFQLPAPSGASTAFLRLVRAP